MNNKHVLLALIFLGQGAYLTYLCNLNKSAVLLELIGTQHMHAKQMPLQKKMNLYFHTIKSIFIFLPRLSTHLWINKLYTVEKYEVILQ